MASHMAQPGGAPLASLASHSPGAEFSQMMVAHVVSTESMAAPTLGHSSRMDVPSHRTTTLPSGFWVTFAMRSSGSPTACDRTRGVLANC